MENNLKSIITKKVFEGKSIHQIQKFINDCNNNKYRNIYLLLKSYLSLFYKYIIEEYDESKPINILYIYKLSCDCYHKVIPNNSDYKWKNKCKIIKSDLDHFSVFSNTLLNIDGKSILDKFETISRCNCCIKHKKDKPKFIDFKIVDMEYKYFKLSLCPKTQCILEKELKLNCMDYKDSSDDELVYYENDELPTKKYNSLCKCNCRQTNRFICMIFNYYYYQIYKKIPNLEILKLSNR
jgi:hypothetical protein